MESLNSLIHTLSENNLYRSILASSSQIYSIRPLKLETIQPAQLLQYLLQTQQNGKQTYKELHPDATAGEGEAWASNEFRLFAWLAVCYSSLKDKGFSRFKDQDYSLLAAAFPHKSRAFLRYNLRILSKDSSRRSKWTEQQAALFQAIKSQHTECKWTQISLQLFMRSNGSFMRTPQQCREQWINHLNPNVNKQKWSVGEDVALIRAVLQEGKRWSQISKIFAGQRTEHMVKNRFKSILNQYKIKSRKISERRLCEDLLFLMQQTSAQSQTRRQRKDATDCASDPVSQHAEDFQQHPFKFDLLLAKTQTKVQNFITQSQETKGEQQVQHLAGTESHKNEGLWQQNIKIEFQDMEKFQYYYHKTAEDNYIQQLLQ